MTTPAKPSTADIRRATGSFRVSLTYASAPDLIDGAVLAAEMAEQTGQDVGQCADALAKLAGAFRRADNVARLIGTFFPDDPNAAAILSGRILARFGPTIQEEGMTLTVRPKVLP